MAPELFPVPCKAASRVTGSWTHAAPGWLWLLAANRSYQVLNQSVRERWWRRAFTFPISLFSRHFRLRFSSWSQKWLANDNESGVSNGSGLARSEAMFCKRARCEILRICKQVFETHQMFLLLQSGDNCMRTWAHRTIFMDLGPRFLGWFPIWLNFKWLSRT